MKTNKTGITSRITDRSSKSKNFGASSNSKSNHACFECIMHEFNGFDVELVLILIQVAPFMLSNNCTKHLTANI